MKAVKYWKLVAGTPQLGGPQVGWYAERWRPSDVFPNNVKNPLPQLLRTPSKFDDFILISVGPGNSTGGIVTPRPNSQFVADVRAQANYNDDDFYYYLALRAYFLATRDANDNRLWDFDLRNRTRKAEAKALAPAGLNLLPDGTDGYGPLIYLPNENGV